MASGELRRCMGCAHTKYLCETCKRLARSFRDEEAEKWIEPVDTCAYYLKAKVIESKK